MGSIIQKTYDDLGKGVNTFTRDTMIKENESAYASNVYAVGKNSIRKRPGIRLLATLPGGQKVSGLGRYYSGNTRELLAVSNGVPYKVHTGTPTVITGKTFSTTANVDFCQAGRALFMQDGVTPLCEYAGSTIADTTNGIIGKYLIYYKSCLWTWGNPTAGNETRLYRSGTDTKIGDFTYNASTNPLATSVYVSKDDGQKLKGGFKHQDFLYLAKEKSLWRSNVAADAAGTISLELIDPARGADSHKTIDAVENDNFMFSENGIFASGYEPNIDQVRTNIVSLRIQDKLNTIEKTNLDDTCGIFFDSHYYLSYASGSSTENDTIQVYDRQRMGWWEWDLGATCFCEYKDANGNTRLYFGTADGKIYYFDESYNGDDSQPIKTLWKTSKFSFQDYSQMKFFMNVIIYVGKTAGEITYTVYIDNEPVATDIVKIGNTGSAGMGGDLLGSALIGQGSGQLTIEDTGGGDFIKIPINKLGRNIQVQIEDNNNNKSWEVNALVFQFKPLNQLYQPNTK